MTMPRVRLTATPTRPDGQRDARAVDHPRHQIAAEPVGAEQEQLPALGRTGKMQVAGKQAPELVAVAVAEKPQRLALFRVRRVDPLEPLHVEPIVETEDERGDQPALVKDVHRLRRRIDEVGVAGVDAVGGEELADRDPEIHRQQDHPGGDGDAVALQLPPHHPPLRGDVEALLRRRHPLDGIGIVRCGRHVVRQRLDRVLGRPVWRLRGEGQIAHWRRPACSRMRGIEQRQARDRRRTRRSPSETP